MGGTPSNEILPLDTSEEVLPHNLEDTNCRSWEVEYDTNIQTTKVKGRLKNNVAYWQDTLQAPVPVLDWIQNGYKLPLSLGTLVPNSRDRHEKQWRPDFTRHKKHPKIRFV